MADKFGPEMEGQDRAIDKNDYICYPADAQQIFDLLAGCINHRIFLRCL
jgi:hypothetical protein